MEVLQFFTVPTFMSLNVARLLRQRRTGGQLMIKALNANNMNMKCGWGTKDCNMWSTILEERITQIPNVMAQEDMEEDMKVI